LWETWKYWEAKRVEEEKDERPETPSGDLTAAAPVAEKSDSMAIRRALTRLLRKRMKKFIALVPQVLTDASPNAVHDARVWSRRVQQAVSVFFPKPRSGKVRRLRRTPRRIRRALGEWRNCDVLLELVARQQRRTRSEAKRRAWAFVRDYLLQKRGKEVARAGKKLLRQDLGDYALLAQRLLGHPPDESPEILMRRLGESVREAWSQWRSALARAQETRAVEDLHLFRIATKDIRYRTELLYDVGHKDMKETLKWLKALQDAIGAWHDRQVLHQAVAEAVARAEVLLNELPTVRLLLAELETDRSRQSQDIDKVFRLAIDHPDHNEMASWSETPLTPHIHP
jgi:CHAD domain-containing protein